MLTYHGWDWEETHRTSTTPTTLKRTSSLDHQYGQRVSSSFTPVNYHQAPVQFISPLRTLHSRGIDGDGLYDLPQEDVVDTCIRNERMRTSAHVNNGREVSIGGVWEYRDEEDLAYQKLSELKASAPKRRKSAPAKRSKSTKAPSKTLAELWESDELRLSQQGKEEGSQLTTPSDSMKRPKKRPASSVPNNKEKITKAFRNPTITKSALVRGKNTDHGALKIGLSSGVNASTPETPLPGDLPRSQHISNHQGWTTTEDAVKHSYNGIAKTTLDKLAAFRYKSSTTDRLPEAPSTNLPEKTDLVDVNIPPAHLSPGSGNFTHDEIFGAFHGSAMTEASLPREHSQPSQIRTGDITSDNDMLSTNDTFFKDAVWNVKSSAGGYVTSGSFERAALSQSLIPSEHGASTSDQGRSDYGDPTSSEARALRSLISEADLVREQQSVPGIALFLSNSEGSKLESTINPELMLKFQTDVQISRPDQLDELHRQVENTSKALLINDETSRKLIDIQVERSDVDEDEIVSENVFNDYDEFCEGLDDADLLALASDSVIPETQMIQGSRPNVPLSVGESSRINVPNPEMKSLGGQQDLELSRESSPELLDSELDEYLLDQLDVEAILQFPEPKTVVVEKRQAPISVQYSLGIGPASDGVYDPCLQFSPPKSRTSVSSEKLPDAWLTNITSTNNSPKHRLDLALISIGGEEEEDWAFIRSKDSHFDDNTEDSEVQRAESQRVPPYDKVSNGLFRKRDARTQATTTEGSTTLVLSMLDDSHEYKPLKPFARPDFPILVPDRCPVVGTSAQTFLRVCFRIGEMFKEGARCNALSQDAVIELFARVTFSSREPGTTKQHFQFADLWHDRPPFPNGLLTNYKTSGLAESESKVFIGAKVAMMARCLGRLKRESKSESGWLLHIITIRSTDWEEIRWTKRIVSADLVKSEFKGLSKL